MRDYTRKMNLEIIPWLFRPHQEINVPETSRVEDWNRTYQVDKEEDKLGVYPNVDPTCL